MNYLGYLDGSSVITRILKIQMGRQKSQRRRYDGSTDQSNIAMSQWMLGPQEAGQGKDLILPQALLKRYNYSYTLINPIRPVLDL